jgi:hypothetical protein
MGAALAAAGAIRPDDSAWHFLPASILRATRDGYVSTSRGRARAAERATGARHHARAQGVVLVATSAAATAVADAEPRITVTTRSRGSYATCRDRAARCRAADVASGSGAASFRRVRRSSTGRSTNPRGGAFENRIHRTGELPHLSSLTAGGGWWQMPDLWSGRIATIRLARRLVVWRLADPRRDEQRRRAVVDVRR